MGPTVCTCAMKTHIDTLFFICLSIFIAVVNSFECGCDPFPLGICDDFDWDRMYSLGM